MAGTCECGNEPSGSIKCGGMDWIELGQVADTCECGNELSGSIKCGEFLD